MAEKQLNELSPDQRRLYAKAVEAAQRENFDYATTLFCQVLKTEPGLFEARKALRAAQTARSAGESKGFFKKMMSNAGSSPQITKAKMTLSKNPAEAMAIAEEVLNGDANNPFAHRIIVDAAMALELPQTAVLSLETMVRLAPKDKALVVEFANAVAETGGNAEVAEEFLDELIRTTPYDPDLKQAQKNLSAHKTLDQGGYNALAAMSMLAQCFAKRNMNDSAVRTLQNAIKEKPAFDDEKKDLIYNLGCVFEKMGKKAEAIEQFLIIYEADVTYRDVGAKVDAHYAAQ